MLTAQQILDALIASSHEVTLQQVTDAMAGVDQAALSVEERAKLTVVLWDKDSPINGTPAADVLAARADIDPAGAVYLINDVATDKTLYLQPHVPGVDGHVLMTAEDYLDHATPHAHAIADSAADRRTFEAVYQALGL